MKNINELDAEQLDIIHTAAAALISSLIENLQEDENVECLAEDLWEDGDDERDVDYAVRERVLDAVRDGLNKLGVA